MALFDTHVHLDDKRYDADREALIQGLPGQGVLRCLTVGADMPSSQRALELAAKYPMLRATAGVHPHEATTVDETALNQLRQWLALPQVVALGEIGLDYYYDHSPRDVQREAFGLQWDMGLALDMPIVFHIRDAWADFFSMLKTRPHEGIAHCFSGDKDAARHCLDKGLYIAFGGAITFKNAHVLRETALYVPLDRLLLETDCPYLAPHPFRGGRNEPAYVRYVAQQLAQIRGVDEDELADITYANACRVLRWD